MASIRLLWYSRFYAITLPDSLVTPHQHCWNLFRLRLCRSKICLCPLVTTAAQGTATIFQVFIYALLAAKIAEALLHRLFDPPMPPCAPASKVTEGTQSLCFIFAPLMDKVTGGIPVIPPGSVCAHLVVTVVEVTATVSLGFICALLEAKITEALLHLLLDPPVPPWHPRPPRALLYHILTLPVRPWRLKSPRHYCFISLFICALGWPKLLQGLLGWPGGPPGRPNIHWHWGRLNHIPSSRMFFSCCLGSTAWVPRNGFLLLPSPLCRDIFPVVVWEFWIPRFGARVDYRSGFVYSFVAHLCLSTALL